MRIAALYEREETKIGCLTAELRRLYDGDLIFPVQDNARPYVIGNFVETLDGVVSYSIPGRSGGTQISGANIEDRFVMGLLRALCDAVLVGSGTLHADPGHVRIPEFIYPEAKDLYAALRKKLGKPALPLNVSLTASGKIDLDEPTFHTEGLRAVVITTEEGALRLLSARSDKPENVIVRSTGESGSTSPQAVLKILADEFGVKLLLHEGGPVIFGEFLSTQMVDELFLTLAPQIAGRGDASRRPTFAGKALFLPETAPWLKLASVKRGSSHLLLRYITTR